jgi:hypothetical protein
MITGHLCGTLTFPLAPPQIVAHWPLSRPQPLHRTFFLSGEVEVECMILESDSTRTGRAQNAAIERISKQFFFYWSSRCRAASATKAGQGRKAPGPDLPPPEILDIYGSSEFAITLALNNKKSFKNRIAGHSTHLASPLASPPPCLTSRPSCRPVCLASRAFCRPSLRSPDSRPASRASLASERPPCFSPRFSCRPSMRSVWEKTGGATAFVGGLDRIRVLSGG